MLFDEGDDKMVKTEAFPTIRMKIDRLLKITNEYQFNDLVKAVYCINLCINNRSVLESCLALNACLIEYEEKGAIIFNMVDVGYDTENEAVVDYFKEELKDYPFHMRDYLFREPFSWKIEKRDFDTYEYTVKHGGIKRLY